MAAASRLEISMAAFRSAGRNGALRLLQAARLSSVTGRWAYTVTLAVFAFRAGGAGGVAVAGIVRLAPAALAAPFAGVFVRRIRAQHFLLQAGVVRTAALAGAGFAVVSGWPQWTVYACAAVEAATSTLLRPVQNSLLPSLARTPEELTSANLSLSVIESAGVLMGPLIGAALLQRVTVGGVFLVAAGAYLVSLLLIVPLALGHVDELVPAPAAPGAPLRRRRIAVPQGDARIVLLLYGAQNLVAGALNVLIVVTALRLLGLGQSSVGTLTAAIGVGGVVGGGLLLSRVRAGKHGSDLAIGLALWGAAMLLLAVATSEAVAFALLGVVGVGVTVVDVSAVTLLQRASQGTQLTDALGLLQAVFVGSVGIGTLLAPLLVSAIGVRGALLACGIPLPVLASALWRRLQRVDAHAERSPWSTLVDGIPIFVPLSAGARDRIASMLSEVRMLAGNLVFAQGAAGDAFYMIAAGTCAVEIDGRRVRMLGAGESFGEIALLRPVPRTATVLAVEDCLLLRLERAPFLEIVTGNRASADAADAVVGAHLSFSGGLVAR